MKDHRTMHNDHREELGDDTHHRTRAGISSSRPGLYRNNTPEIAITVTTDRSKTYRGIIPAQNGYTVLAPGPAIRPAQAHNGIPAQDEHIVTDDPRMTATTFEKPGAPIKNYRIFILGPTGAGKSSFIKAATGCDVPVGHGIKSCENNFYHTYKCFKLTFLGTTECKSYTVQHPGGSTYTLVDTPGFNDSSMDDLEILKSIGSSLMDNSHSPASGILYFHPITDMKMYGTSVLNLQILKKLCGKHFYPGVALVLTMWNKIRDDDGLKSCEVRAREIIDQEQYWGEMLRRGSQHFRFEGDRDSSLKVLQDFATKMPDDLPLPRLVRQRHENITWEETSASQVILEERRRREQKRLKEMEDEKAEIEAEQAELQEKEQSLRNQHEALQRGRPDRSMKRRSTMTEQHSFELPAQPSSQDRQGRNPKYAPPSRCNTGDCRSGRDSRFSRAWRELSKPRLLERDKSR